MPTGVAHVEKHFAHHAVSTPIPVVLSLIMAKMGALASDRRLQLAGAVGAGGAEILATAAMFGSSRSFR
jgi:hypothetical protein